MKDYGHFLENGEFLITNPATPRRWWAWLAGRGPRALLSVDGQEEIYLDGETYKCSKLIYLRDNDTGKFWNIGWHPVGTPYEAFSARISPGELHLKTLVEQLEASLSVKLDQKTNEEIWQLSLENKSQTKRRISVFFVVAWQEKVSAVRLSRNTIIATGVSPEHSALNTQTDASELASYYLKLGSADSFETVKERFIGAWGSFSRPQAVLDGKCSQMIATADEDSLAVSQKNITTTRGTVGLEFRTGLTKPSGQAAAREMNWHWERALEAIALKTPVSEDNLAFNSALKYQIASTSDAPAEPLELMAMVSMTDKPQQFDQDITQMLSAQKTSGQFDSPEKTLDLLELIIRYQFESGNKNFLIESVSYLDSGSGSILSHMIRAIRFLIDELSDTNSAVVPETGRVSYLIRQVMPILENQGEHHLVRELESFLQALSKKVARQYRGGIWATPNRKGLIIAREQLWLIIGNLLEAKQAQRLFELLWRRLYSPVGIRERWPIQKDNPGCRGNGAVNAEDSALMMWVSCLMGQPERSYKIWQTLNPVRLSRLNLGYDGEPYLVPSLLFGPDHPRSGKSYQKENFKALVRLYLVLTEQMLGVRASPGGLRIEPRLPADWQQVNFSRPFRGADYHIRLHDPLQAKMGIERIMVDGVRQTGKVILPFSGGKHFIEVALS